MGDKCDAKDPPFVVHVAVVLFVLGVPAAVRVLLLSSMTLVAHRPHSDSVGGCICRWW